MLISTILVSCSKNLKPFGSLILSLYMVAACFENGYAFLQFKPGEETTIDCDITLSYGTGWRLKDPDSGKLANANSNDGNYDFDQVDMTSNRFSIIADIVARH